MSVEPRRPWLPPRWFVRGAWVVHRAIYSITGGRFGLRTPTSDRYGMLRLTTTGRRTGEARRVIVAYLEDGPNLVLVAMNGWAQPEPAWWLNLQANPAAMVELPNGSRAVTARAVNGEERARLRAEFAGGPWRNLEEYATLRSRETSLVMLEPRRGS